MNADEMEAGFEFDTLIAEWIEQKPYITYPSEIIIAREMSGEITYSEKRAWVLTCNYGTGDTPVWMPRKFSQDIAAVWEVVERMLEKERVILLDNDRHEHLFGPWRCTFVHEDFVDYWWDAGWTGCAATPQLAICRATLKAVQ